MVSSQQFPLLLSSPTFPLLWSGLSPRLQSFRKRPQCGSVGHSSCHESLIQHGLPVGCRRCRTSTWRWNRTSLPFVFLNLSFPLPCFPFLSGTWPRTLLEMGQPQLHLGSLRRCMSLVGSRRGTTGRSQPGTAISCAGSVAEPVQIGWIRLCVARVRPQLSS